MRRQKLFVVYLQLREETKNFIARTVVHHMLNRLPGERVGVSYKALEELILEEYRRDKAAEAAVFARCK